MAAKHAMVRQRTIFSQFNRRGARSFCLQCLTVAGGASALILVAGAGLHTDMQLTAAAPPARLHPFTWECLEWAMTHNERGVWAGTTENQRAAMRRIAKEMDKRVG